MEKILGVIIIICMTLISKFMRQLAFGRADSIALEVAVCSFLYNFLYATSKSRSMGEFIHGELLRCITLLLFAFIIAIVHHYYKSMCMQKVEKIVDGLSTRLGDQDDEKNKSERDFEKALLKHTEVIAQQSIDVWYSEFVDALLYRFIKKTNRPEEKTLRKKKSIIRWAFADILNAMEVTKKNNKKLNDRDFNIDIQNQKMGMVIFDTMEILSIIVAVRII